MGIFCFAMGLRKKCPSNKNIVIVSLILFANLSIFGLPTKLFFEFIYLNRIFLYSFYNNVMFGYNYNI